MTEATAPATETLADEATMQELVKLNEQRAATYGLLSRLYRVEVDQPLLDELRSMRFPAKTGNENVDEGYRLLATYLSNTWDNSVTDLAIDYVRVFIGHGIDAFSAAYRSNRCTPPRSACSCRKHATRCWPSTAAQASTSRTHGKRARITLHSSWSSSRSWPRARSKRCAKATKTRPSRC